MRCPNRQEINVTSPKLWVSELYDYYFTIIVSGVRLSPLGTAATIGLLYQPQMIDDVDCGAIGGTKIDRRN
jgi:hypothetical protein